MGLLDSIIGALTSGNQGHSAGGGLGGLGGLINGGGGGGQAALISLVLGMLANRGGGGANAGAGGLGGLGDLLSRFQQAGLGDAAASWVGTGQNIPVSPDQVEGALGSDLLAQIAQHVGLSQGETASHLSEMLPQVVDRVTPGGQIPDGGVDIAGFEGMDDLLGRFSKL